MLFPIVALPPQIVLVRLRLIQPFAQVAQLGVGDGEQSMDVGVAQGAGLGIPSQFMSALPYLATVIVLVLISRARTGGSTAPAALGTVFVPDR